MCVCGLKPEEAFLLDWVKKPLEQSVGSVSAVVDLRQIRQECPKGWTDKSFSVICLTVVLLKKTEQHELQISTDNPVSVVVELDTYAFRLLLLTAAGPHVGFQRFHSFLFI